MIETPRYGGLKITDEARSYVANNGWSDKHGVVIVRRLLDWIERSNAREKTLTRCRVLVYQTHLVKPQRWRRPMRPPAWKFVSLKMTVRLHHPRVLLNNKWV